MQYYGTRLSENISRREPEGYLLCLNVPVARTGFQEYLPEELGFPRNGDGPERGRKPLRVYRPESEVFSRETIASFEGMPVTNNHPPDGVGIDNIRRLQMGHAHNVRRGAGGEADLLLADLIITDPCLIDAILAGKREISCGYTYELHEENGQYVQRKIRGNHVAVVDSGRAGPRVSIKDHKQERSRTPMKKSLSRLLARMAKDGDVETVAEFIEEMMEESGETPPEALAEAAEEAEPVTVEVPEKHEITIDEDILAGILERLDRLIGFLMPSETGAGDDGLAEEVAEAVEEVIEAAETAEEENGDDPAAEIAELVESVVEPAVSTVLSEEKEKDCGSPEPADAKDTLRAVLTAVRPVLAKMTPEQRRKICGDIVCSMRASRSAKDSGIYAGLARARRAPRNDADLGRRIMASRNPCYQK